MLRTIPADRRTARLFATPQPGPSATTRLVVRTVAVTTFALASLAACGEKPAPPATVAAVPVPRAPAPGDPTCPRDGLWKSCALVDRIVHAGLAFKADSDTVTVPYLKPRGVRFRVGRYASLLAFFYADTNALNREWAKLDTLRLAPPGDTVGAWPSRPEVIRSANLIVAMFSNDVRQKERVRLAVTAGAPQAPSTPPVPTLPAAVTH